MHSLWWRTYLDVLSKLRCFPKGAGASPWHGEKTKMHFVPSYRTQPWDMPCACKRKKTNLRNSWRVKWLKQIYPTETHSNKCRWMRMHSNKLRRICICIDCQLLSYYFCHLKARSFLIECQQVRNLLQIETFHAQIFPQVSRHYLRRYTRRVGWLYRYRMCIMLKPVGQDLVNSNF
jgi:hypothetical protein